MVGGPCFFLLHKRGDIRAPKLLGGRRAMQCAVRTKKRYSRRQGVSATPVAGNAATYLEQVAEAAKGSDEAMPCHFSRWA